VSGFSIDEAVGLLQGLRGLNIIGADVVCMVPSKDSPNQITALTSTAVMFEQISLIADTLASNT
jgi:guanidinopropionase